MDRAIKIYIDSNVLIHYCTNVLDVVEALNYVFKKRKKDKLFTSSLAIAQTIATLQKNMNGRKAYSKEKTISDLTHRKLCNFKTEIGNLFGEDER